MGLPFEWCLFGLKRPFYVSTPVTDYTVVTEGTSSAIAQLLPTTPCLDSGFLDRP